MALAGFWAVRVLLRRDMEPNAGPASGDAMVRDPVCGVYLPGHMAIKRKIGGQELYFCSAKCESGYIVSGSGRSEAAPREEVDEG
jgi:YHS domain-containing protein